MPQVQSLDDLIAKKAIEYADQIKAAAAMADKEEEIRIESEKQLAFIQKEAGIKLEGKHEFTVASGRIDSVYSRVIIEYKNPKSPGDHIGPKGDSPGSKKVIEQIKKRFYDMRHEHGQPLNSLFGVGLDGNYFIFVRFRDEKWQVQEPVEVNSHSAERFLWALFNLGTKGKAFSPEYLAGDFGSEGGNTVAISGIHALYDAIVTTDNPKAQIFFSQWKILFGEVCGYDVDSQSEKLRKLAEFYQVDVKNAKPAELLFAVHTYYALFMKLLAAEIVAFFHKLPTPLQKMIQATTSNKLKREMEDLEAGSIFRHLNITNFLEGDLFAWYTSVWTEPIEKLVREMVTRLDDYNPGTLSEDPAGSRDLLKRLYQQLFPKSVRHDLGEYYTPDWLAEHVLNELGYAGDPDKRLLDPACGSGTFLVMAINHIRKWYDENRECCRFDESELGRKILANVIGFDLNPLAVMAARTNYLIAIRDLIGRIDKVEIPIYLCDSVLTPSEYGGLFAGGLGKAKELKTAAATFIVPTEITNSREDAGKYAEVLEFCVQNGYTPNEFLQRCRDENLPITEDTIHMELYGVLVSLDKANKNGVWARIIKNAFAPLFIGKVHYIAGNPPWINWESLPNLYRESTKALWQRYRLFEQRGYRAKLGGAKDDISVLMTYVAHDCYLSDGGSIGFVITQSVFKTKGGGEGFRRFSYTRDDGKICLSPIKVHDFSAFQPFEGATNKTATITAGKIVTPISYPIDYVIWTKNRHESITQELSLNEVMERTQRRSLLAEPVDELIITSPWLTGPREILVVLKKMKGKSPYKPRKGVYCPTNAIYWLANLDNTNDKYALITNMANSGKKQVKAVTQSVEKDFVYRLVRGKDVAKWHWTSSLFIILPQDQHDPSKAVPEVYLKSKYPKTFAYFKQFEKEIRSCALLKQFFNPQLDPFYSSYNVGSYTFMRFKVVWKEICPEIEATVVESSKDTIIPDHKLVIVGFEERQPADFLCGILNSSIVSLFVRTYAIQTSISGHIAEFCQIPTFSATNTLHKQIADLARQCQITAAIGDSDKLVDLQDRIDQAVCALWDISNEELKLILGELRERRSGMIPAAASHEADG